MKKNRLNTNEMKKNNKKPLAVNNRRFIYYGAFINHLRKCMDKALDGNINATV